MQWILKELSDEHRYTTHHLAQELGISNTLAQLLVLRGIKNFDEAKKFFRPDLEDLHTPFLMKDMDVAVSRLHKAIQNKEKILIYGDYDVDGTTAVAAMYLFLSRITNSNLIDYYVPDRFSEGYGVSYQGIEYAKSNHFSLMIILDCGIKEVEKINYAQSLGIDCIICDHHMPPEVLPKAYAVLNPKMNGCSYPYKELTGCGIGFKLMQGYCQKYHLDKTLPYEFLDILTASIAADLVPIDGENRILAYYGLKKINENPSLGIKNLFELAYPKKEKKIKIADIVFALAPRINAAGRLEHGSKAVQLLISQTDTEAEKWAKELHNVNAQRQDIDKQTFEEALQLIEKDKDFINKTTTIVFNSQWNKGVVGIVAAKLVEKFYRPTIVLTEYNGYITGSARSVEGFDLYESLCECKAYLHQFGGHKHAAGLNIQKQHLQDFIHVFETKVKEKITPEQLVKKIYADAELQLDEITPKFLRILKQFEPHGPSNMTPVFWLKNVSDSGRMHEIGNGHLRLNLVQNSHKEYPAVFFNGIEHYEKIKGKKFDCLCKIEINDTQEFPIYNIIIQYIKT